MAVQVIADPSHTSRISCGRPSCANPSSNCLERASRDLTIGLINNMPDGALEATERQFQTLLTTASDGYKINLLLLTLPGVPRSASARQWMGDRYLSVETLLDRSIDGLIVTGREPITASLSDEPYWPALTRVIDWARTSTRSAIWSCLAAHAAALYLDGIPRQRSSQKCSGVINCTRLSDHAILRGMPEQYSLPHSRWNGLSEEMLRSRGYEVLSRAGSYGVDSFLKEDKSLFLFFQGHPEYDPESLLMEYRRDVYRYMRGEAATRPHMPSGYFSPQIEERIQALEAHASTLGSVAWGKQVQSLLAEPGIVSSWNDAAVSLYTNWLRQISARKLQQISTHAERPHAAPLPPAALKLADIQPRSPNLIVV